MIEKLLISVLLTSSLFGSDIKIAVAANVSYAIKSLIKEFNKQYPDTRVRVTLGSSGKLTAQIIRGAPYQILMSANMSYPEALYENGLATTKPTVYALGNLAYLSSKKQDFSKGISLLEDSKIEKIAVANPKTAPYGKATVEAMKNMKIYEKIKNKFVFSESISQTVSYTIIAADIGFIAKSSLFSPKMSHFKKNIHWDDIDSKFYTPIKQGIVILKDGKENRDVLAFYNFILSEKAQKIFKDFGYTIL